ncbi:MAG: sterol carrier protein [Gemmatimonadetes bacterium]|nr:sterol carrier protein [Gemmatimonadota bacterium]
MAITHVKQIFDEFPNRFNPDGAGDWTAVIQFKISGDKGGDFYLSVGGGQCASAEGVHESPTSTITAADETWIGVIEGTVNPMTAFMTQKLKVEGDMGAVMKLQNPAIFANK